MDQLTETLPPPQRLALAYAPRHLRAATLGLLALDTHLATLVRRAREPILGQMRLAWWRERLGEPVGARPSGDALLDALAAWDGHEASLVALVDGWEHLLAEELTEDALAGFVMGRTLPFAGLAELAGLTEFQAAASHAGRRWALADLAAHLSDPRARATVVGWGNELGPRQARLPRALRPIAVLDGLAQRSLARGGTPLAAGPRSAFAALRLGIIGR